MATPLWMPKGVRMVKVPSGEKHAFICKTLPGPAIELVLVRDGIEFKSHPIMPAAASIVAATALNSAKDCHDQSGAPLTHGPDIPRPRPPFLSFSSIGLGPGSKKGAALVIRFGDAEIGFDLPDDVLKPLGQALIAASAAGTKQ
jgi:hypothetical protein